MSYITDTSTPASKVIHLDSGDAHTYHHKDAEGNEISSSFLFHMSEAIVCPEHLSMICSLHSCTIPYTFYNVRNDVNNAVVFTYGGSQLGALAGDYKVVFPSGSYTALSFLNEFVGILNGEPNYLRNPWATYNDVSVYRIYYNQLGVWRNFQEVGLLDNPFLRVSGGKVATKISGNLDRVRLRYHLYETNDTASVSTVTMQWAHADTTALDLFGFRTDAPTLVPYTSDETVFLASDKVIDMNDEIHGLYLRTSLTTDGTLNSETGTFSNILSRISINTNFGGVIFHTPNNSTHKLESSLPVVKSIGVKLTDDHNRLIDLNGLHFQVAFQIDFVARLDQLQGLTKTQRRAGAAEYEAALKRLDIKQSKISKPTPKIKKTKVNINK
jgi:hypothetical protein